MTALNDVASISFRPVAPEDEAFLFTVFASSRKDEIAAWGWDQSQQESFLRMQFRGQQFHYDEIEESGNSVILSDGCPIGRLIVDRTEREILLAEIALLPEYRNAGIGTRIIKDLMAEAAGKGLPFCLHVTKTNRAFRLYQRLGFTITKDTGTHFEMEWRTSPTD